MVFPAEPPDTETGRRKLRVGATQTGGGDATIPPGMPHDLLRLNGTAVIGDPRNDENLLVAQTHLLFMKFHLYDFRNNMYDLECINMYG